MSASSQTSAIYLTDTEKQIKDKINKYAFSGGQETLELHREKGGNPDVDVAYQYLTYFVDDDADLQATYDAYRAGTLTTGDLKKKCIKVLADFIKAFQEVRGYFRRLGCSSTPSQERKGVTDEILNEMMSVRPLNYKI